ncbi:hypothetical protein NM688_g4393 [Phlebia brevispora]|uniref:Uncharacterized protein n=1 Tax=Phlebia brevispora TaxID=194682 RepID=A0ACC1T3F2_9APHY|nr:hypothetical protein NM688_g4393 [Phlebia brevispora]
MSDPSHSGLSSPSSSTPPTSTPPSPALSALILRDVSEEAKQEAARIKGLANKAFLSHRFNEAADLYTKAIEQNPKDATLWCNRAYTRIKLEEHGYGLSDAATAIQLDPKYAKAYYRRATCYLQTLRYKQAIADFRKLLALEPQNALVREQLESTQKILRKAEFEKAIEVEEEKNAAERCIEIIQEGGCDLDRTYDGPKLPTQEDGSYTISLQFIKDMHEWFKAGKTLPRRYVWEIAIHAYNYFVQEESLVTLPLEDGVICDVIGDVHGQFYDMLHLFSLTGEPSENHCLLMNGDLVDRGSWSIEVILTALAYKWLYPKRMYINRGNHETKEMNRTYGFEGEAKHKHGEQTYKLFAQLFTAMPLATLICPTKPPTDKTGILSPEGKKRYFVVHGGLFSKDGVTLDDIRKIDRIGKQPGQEGIMCELLWTDPQELPGRGPSKRGVGIAFGPDVTRRWCLANGITGIIRSHEVRQDGYAIEHDGLCTTVFSAPNYVDQAGNKGAFIRINDAGTREYTQFEATPHPPMKPMAYASGGLASLLISVACSDVPKSELPVPAELAIQIVSFLDAVDILTCRLVCKQLKSLVDTVSELQYSLELTASRCHNNPISGFTTSKRLRLLKDRQIFWKKPAFKPVCDIDFKPQNYNYHGNILIKPRQIQGFGDSKLWNGLDCVALELDSEAVKTREWSLQFKFAIESYAVDPSRGLLVLLRWRPRAWDNWIFEIRTVSLKDGQETSTGYFEVPAPRRYTEESPPFYMQGNMLSIITRDYLGEESDQRTSIHVTIVNMRTGSVHAELTRSAHSLQSLTETFMFSSDTSFLLAVKQEEFFSIEVYSIQEDATEKGDVMIPTHVATFQFPPVREGCSSVGTWAPFSKSYAGGHGHGAQPFTQDTDSAVININRVYFAGSLASDTIIYLSSYIPLSTFLSPLALHKHRGIEAYPLFLPWREWGPIHTRCFDVTRTSRASQEVPRAACGTGFYDKVDYYGSHAIFDFNQREIARDLSTSCAKVHAGFKPEAPATHSAFRRLYRSMRLGVKNTRKVPRFPGRIVSQPTVIPHGNIFTEDIISMLPYRETPVIWEGAEPFTVLGGDVWIGGFFIHDGLNFEPALILLSQLRMQTGTTGWARGSALAVGVGVTTGTGPEQPLPSLIANWPQSPTSSLRQHTAPLSTGFFLVTSIMPSQKIYWPSQLLTRALSKLKLSRVLSKSSTNATYSDTSESELPIPLELAIQILYYLDMEDVLICRLVCKQLKLLVDIVPELQYRLELAVSRCQDNSACESNIPQRLQHLREMQTFWKKPAFKNGPTIHLEPLNYSYHGNIFIMPRRTEEFGDQRLYNAFDCVTLEPNDDSNAVTTHEWSLELDFGAESYTVDLSNEVLVLLHWRLRARHTHNDWIFEIRSVSLKDSQGSSIERVVVPAPRRDFEESPSLEIHNNMLSIVAGGLYGEVSDQKRNIYVTIMSTETGLVYAQLTRCCEHGLEYNSKTFTFASETSFLLTVKYEGFFAIELYSIAQDIAQTNGQNVVVPTHIATFQFPPLKKGFSSAGAWNPFNKSYTGGRVVTPKLGAQPFVHNQDSAIINVNRVYYGPSASEAIQVNCYIPLSAFLSPSELSTWRTDPEGPLFIPWSEWGPIHARCFDVTHSKAIHTVPTAACGSRVYDDGVILDFNQREIARDLRTSCTKVHAGLKSENIGDSFHVQRDRSQYKFRIDGRSSGSWAPWAHRTPTDCHTLREHLHGGHRQHAALS